MKKSIKAKQRAKAAKARRIQKSKSVLQSSIQKAANTASWRKQATKIRGLGELSKQGSINYKDARAQLQQIQSEYKAKSLERTRLGIEQLREDFGITANITPEQASKLWDKINEIKDKDYGSEEYRITITEYVDEVTESSEEQTFDGLMSALEAYEESLG